MRLTKRTETAASPSTTSVEILKVEGKIEKTGSHRRFTSVVVSLAGVTVELRFLCDEAVAEGGVAETETVAEAAFEDGRARDTGTS
jgi:hypothetical protein